MSLGLALKLANATLFKGGGVRYSAEATALFARFTTPPTTQRKALIDALIVSLKTAGVWSKLDALYLTAAADSQAARRNWIADQYNLTAVAAPTFSADRGYQGDGTNSYLGTGFTPSSATTPQYTQNSASYGVWSRTAAASATTNEIDMGPSLVAPRADMRVRRSDGVAALIINDNTLNSAASTDGSGLFIAIRSGSAARELRRNNAQLVADATASTGLPTSAFSVLAGGASPGRSARQACSAFIGGALTPTEANALYAAQLTYLQAVGAA